MTKTDIWVAPAICIALVLLAGCSAPAASESPESHETSAKAEAIEYPVGFPTDEVPMFEGALLHVAHPGNLWAAWIESDDLAADLAAASQLLLDAGYTQTTTADGYAEFSNPQRTLRIVASVDGTYGSCLAYTLTDGAVEPDDAQEQDASPEPTESSEH